MAAKQILFHNTARERLAAGVNVLANAVKATLGPNGLGEVVRRPDRHQGRRYRRKRIELEEKLENMARNGPEGRHQDPRMWPATAPLPRA